MFVQVQNLTYMIDHDIEMIQNNYKIVTGEVENINNLSADYVMDFIKGQIETVDRRLALLKKESSNEKLIKKYEKKVETMKQSFINNV